MSIGGGSNESSGEQSSRPTTPEELDAYFNSLNQLSGGRLGTWGTQGTQATYYDPLTQQQLQAIGGAGATRTNALNESLENQQDQINRNASMTYAQQSQANQNAMDSYNQQADAINKEVEAAMTGLASQEAMRKYQADLANAGLTAQDLALLSQIYYGGKGQYSTGTTSSSGWNANVDLSDENLKSLGF